MHNERFFDQALNLIHQGHAPAALTMLIGKLFNAREEGHNWPATRAALHRHPLYAVLQEDPFNAYSTARPRGYPGDAGLIDIIYDQRVPNGASKLGATLFNVSINFVTPEAVRLRKVHAQKVVTDALQQGKRVCVLASGHFREADGLIGQDLSRVTLVDQDPISLDKVRAAHGRTASICEENVFRFLRAAKERGDQFDLIYTLGLTDYLDARAMQLLHRLVKVCLAPGGTFLLANFLPAHVSTGWMDAVMDWHLICRDEAELEGYARDVDLRAKTWRDQTNSVVWCEMVAARP